MPNAVYVLWWILLIITVLVIPYLVYLLHKASRMAHSIDKYLGQALEAGVDIATNTKNIEFLKDTKDLTNEMLNSAGTINKHTATIEKTLEDRSKKSKKV
jgi:hypothetical protein